MDKGKVICIESTKGGIGKTIFTINMAGIFATINKKVLIIDLDLTSGAIALSLNKNYEKSIYDIALDIKNNTFDEFNNYVTKYNEYIDFLPCPKDPRQASLIDIRYLDIILDRAAYIYDVILIDTNHNLDRVNLYIMDKVDEQLIMISNDPLSIKSTRSFISILNKLEINNYHVILNDSFNPYKSYFSLFDLKSIIKSNIDYTIANEFFVENIDDYIMEGKIITLEKSAPRVFNKSYTSMMLLATDLIKKEGSK